jgi:2-polyprenyl-3-methyl-5-hydroxy-6-metoxy-1,4-benzoquinol methylase
MRNVWHERFQTEEYVYGKEPNAFVKQAAPFLLKGKILCIAEGEGRNSVFLARHGFNVTAWDFAPSALEKTEKLAKEQGVKVKTELKDMAEVEWQTEQWDGIVHIFGHFPEQIRDRTFEGIKKALKPGGFYVSELYTKEQLEYRTGGPRDQQLLIDPKLLLENFSEYCIKHFFIGEVERNEGKLHTGKAHVVQSIFKKS